MNSLTAPQDFILGVKDLLNWAQFLRRLALKLSLPHGDGAVRELLDLKGIAIDNCKDLKDNHWYLAIGTFRGPGFGPRHIKHRVKQLSMVREIELARPKKQDQGPKRPAILMGITPKGDHGWRPPPTSTDASSPAKGPPLIRASLAFEQTTGPLTDRPTRPSALPGIIVATAEGEADLDDEVVDRELKEIPSPNEPHSVRRGQIGTVKPAREAPSPASEMVGFAGNVNERVKDLLAIQVSVCEMEAYSQQGELWEKLRLDGADMVEANLAQAMQLFASVHPLALCPRPVIELVFADLTGRDISAMEKHRSLEPVYRTELVPLFIQLYFSKLVLKAYFDSEEGFTSESFAPNEIEIDFTTFWRGIEALGGGLTLSEAAKQFEVLSSSSKSTGPETTSLGSMCLWYGHYFCKVGTTVALDSFSHGMHRSDVDQAVHDLLALLADQEALQEAWGGDAEQTRSAQTFAEDLSRRYPLMSDTRLALRAANRLASSPGAKLARAHGQQPRQQLSSIVEQYDSSRSVLTLYYDDADAFAALFFYFNIMRLSFPAVVNAKDTHGLAVITSKKFFNMMSVLSLALPATEMQEHFEKMASFHEPVDAESNELASEYTVEVDEVIAWYASLKAPSSAVRIWGGEQTLTAAEEETEPIFLAEVRHASLFVHQPLLQLTLLESCIPWADPPGWKSYSKSGAQEVRAA